VVTITVRAKPKITIVSHRLYANKTEVDVGEEVVFMGAAELSEPLPTSQSVIIDIYVNDKKVDTEVRTAPQGIKRISYTFTLTFQEPGTYRVYTDLSIPGLGIKSESTTATITVAGVEKPGAAIKIPDIVKYGATAALAIVGVYAGYRALKRR